MIEQFQQFSVRLLSFPEPIKVCLQFLIVFLFMCLSAALFSKTIQFLTISWKKFNRLHPPR